MICSSLKKIACIAIIVCTSCVLTSFVEAQMVEDGLVSYWPLDELQAGKKVPDAFGENHGELAGESKMKIVAGKVGGAGKFDGTATVLLPAIINCNSAICAVASCNPTLSGEKNT